MTDPRPWIRLSKTGASARHLNRLLIRFGSPEAIFGQSVSSLAGETGIRQASAERVLAPELADCEADVRLLDQLGIFLMTRGDPAYPEKLDAIFDPPPVLYVRGELGPRDTEAVAVVGSRRATPYGLAQGRRLGRDLAAAGLTVVSGLARGLDTEAHRGALEAGGHTLAVMGCGLDIVYPAENRRLADDIAQNGALVSAFPFGAEPDGWRFPVRNRIISGLCLGVVIIDAPAGSGALLTAESAVDQDREVFCVPGPVDHPNSAGAHQLIRDGATLINGVEQILEEFNFGPRRLPLVDGEPEAPTPPPVPLSPTEQQLRELLDSDPRPIDDLIIESGLDSAQVSGALVTMEIRGLVQRHPGNCFSRT